MSTKIQEYRNILVALDVYSSFDNTLERALCVASSPNTIHLVFVTVPSFYFQPYVAAVGGDVTSDIRQQASKRLQDIAHRHGIPDNQIHVPIGHPADEIHELASQLQSDLIVIGSHGQAGIKLLLGSTANAVLHGVDCDVMAVRVIQ